MIINKIIEKNGFDKFQNQVQLILNLEEYLDIVDLRYYKKSLKKTRKK